MKTKDKLIINKQKELIAFLKDELELNNIESEVGTGNVIESELSVLESSPDGREEEVKPDVNYFRTNILIYLSTEDMIALRNWLNSYESVQSSEPDKPKDKVTAEVKEIRCSNCGELIGNCDMSCWYEDKSEYSESKEVTDEEISKKLDLIDFKTSRERETAFELCVWMRDGKIK